MDLLVELKGHHRELEEALVALRIEVERPMPDERGLSTARLRLSRASGRRKALIECSIYPALHNAGAQAVRQLNELRQEGARLMIESSGHVGRWTMQRVLADWPGYQRASRDLRASMARRIVDEAAILYPLLTGADQSAMVT